MGLNLNDKLKSIGVRINVIDNLSRAIHHKNGKRFDIEETLIEAAREVTKDSKLFSLLASWVHVHGDYVIVEKLMKKTGLLDGDDPARVWINALAIFASHDGFHKWKRWVNKSSVERFLFDESITRTGLRRKGEISWLADQGYLIPEGSLRIRSEDALTPAELAALNQQYRNRLLIGASWRADIVTAIEEGMKSPYQIAQTLGCSYEPAHRVFNEYRIAKGLAA